LSDYSIAAKDSAPVVIGGVGGSGTRLVTQILRQVGVIFDGVVNDSLDNLWFSLLFVRRTIFLKPPEEIRRLIWLFINAMRDSLPVPEELLPLLDEAARYDRGPALRKSVLQEARNSIVQNSSPHNSCELWGWKQPNTHVLVPILAQCLPKMKYIYVVRNGLDMAFSYNQNQLKYFWGDLLLEGEVDPSPRNSLRYWVASYKRICSNRALLDNRLYILDFDLLCRNPVEQIEKLNRFLDMDVDSDELEAVAKTIVLPDSTGRYRDQDCRQLCSEDVEFVRALGFDVPEGF
jgi:hypothetical protein